MNNYNFDIFTKFKNSTTSTIIQSTGISPKSPLATSTVPMSLEASSPSSKNPLSKVLQQTVLHLQQTVLHLQQTVLHFQQTVLQQTDLQQTVLQQKVFQQTGLQQTVLEHIILQQTVLKQTDL